MLRLGNHRHNPHGGATATTPQGVRLVDLSNQPSPRGAGLSAGHRGFGVPLVGGTVAKRSQTPLEFYKNGGKTWRPKGSQERVQVHDFIDDKVGKAIPYGVYDVGRDQGWVNVGCDADTASFAVEIGKDITVCHFPPGTSKWNKVEHRLSSHISMKWW